MTKRIQRVGFNTVSKCYRIVFTDGSDKITDSLIALARQAGELHPEHRSQPTLMCMLAGKTMEV